MAEKITSTSDLHALCDRLLAQRDSHKMSFTLCAGTGCHAYGCMDVYEAFAKGIKTRGWEDKIELRASGCHGFCERGPLLVIQPGNLLYQQVKTRDADEVLDKTDSGEIVERLLYLDEVSGNRILNEDDVPFYKSQKRLVFGMNGQINPNKIDDYLAVGGYKGLAKALSEMDPDAIINEVKTANLRGRGGGGFPAGIKWESCKKAAGTPKYVVCNADEGDPGAYMDRSLLEGNPHLVIEGMLIGAFAIGSNQGYVYVRNEYPLAVKNLVLALDQAREYGLLGKDILGSGFDFDIKINRGGGAFVCGESSALMSSIEGKPGEPTPKYVHMSERGLFDKPTNLNNVETWANVPFIINRGSDWYRSIGTENSKGTKIFSLVGNIKNTGLVEVPMGITLRRIIFDIGGGIPNGKNFKAIQTGGPSGGCIPEKYLDMPVDFDKLYEIGSMMGSGGMIVMDNETCMVDVAKYYTNFLSDESCGKCTPCREGVMQLRDILVDITEGRGQEGDLELMEEMSKTIIDSSLCALGQTAPNPLLTTLEFFREEYQAHIRDHKCPAGVCNALITFEISSENCTGCMLCKKQCPTEAITGNKKEVHVLDQAKCIQCGACYASCKFDAVIKE